MGVKLVYIHKWRDDSQTSINVPKVVVPTNIKTLFQNFEDSPKSPSFFILSQY